LRELNTLHDVKVAHNAVIMVEEKSGEELSAESEGRGENEKDVELLDDSDNLRTVIANISGF